MKKYIALFAALLALVVSSCSNDDLVVDQAITFKVNPSTVVSSLLENKPGDLSSLDDEETLLVELYIYDKSGSLVVKDVQKYNAYTHILNSVQNLSNGEYTVVACTHIEAESKTEDKIIEYWSINGTEKLSTFTVKDNNYIGGSAKLLGLTVQKINVTSATKEVSINVECAGALALVKVSNWKKYSDVVKYAILSKQACDEASIENSTLKYTHRTENTYKYTMALWDYDANYTGGTGYIFLFPTSNIDLYYIGLTTEKLIPLGKPVSMPIVKGHNYYFEYDVQNDVNTWEDRTAQKSSAPAKAPSANVALTDNMLRFNTQTGTITIAQ